MNFNEYYCRKCKKPYDRRLLPFYFGNDITTKFYKEIEVDKKGEPVGYKKIKNA